MGRQNWVLTHLQRQQVKRGWGMEMSTHRAEDHQYGLTLTIKGVHMYSFQSKLA